MISVLLVAVIDDNVKAAAQSHDELLLLLEGMAVSPHSAGNVINPIVAHDLERHVHAALDDREVATRILVLGQLYEMYFVSLI